MKNYYFIIVFAIGCLFGMATVWMNEQKLKSAESPPVNSADIRFWPKGLSDAFSLSDCVNIYMTVDGGYVIIEGLPSLPKKNPCDFVPQGTLWADGQRLKICP